MENVRSVMAACDREPNAGACLLGGVDGCRHRPTVFEKVDRLVSEGDRLVAHRRCELRRMVEMVTR